MLEEKLFTAFNRHSDQGLIGTAVASRSSLLSRSPFRRATRVTALLHRPARKSASSRISRLGEGGEGVSVGVGLGRSRGEGDREKNRQGVLRRAPNRELSVEPILQRGGQGTTLGKRRHGAASKRQHGHLPGRSPARVFRCDPVSPRIPNGWASWSGIEVLGNVLTDLISPIYDAPQDVICSDPIEGVANAWTPFLYRR